jgi:hypothetical protein
MQKKQERAWQLPSPRPPHAEMFRQPLKPESETAVLEILLQHVIHTQECMPGSLKKDSDFLSLEALTKGSDLLSGGGGEYTKHEREEEEEDTTSMRSMERRAIERTAITFRREKHKVLAGARDGLEYAIRIRRHPAYLAYASQCATRGVLPHTAGGVSRSGGGGGGP